MKSPTSWMLHCVVWQEGDRSNLKHYIFFTKETWLKPEILGSWNVLQNYRNSPTEGNMLPTHVVTTRL
jgi:hypothetical protein